MKFLQPSRLIRTGISALALGFLLVGCAATMDAGSHCTVDPNYLRDEQTFTWSPDGAVDLIDESGYISPAIVEQLKKRVVRELNFKGFRFIETPAADQPVDVTVQLYLRARKELVVSNAYGGIAGPCVHPECAQGAYPNAPPVSTQTTGFLAADVYHQGEAIWRGWVERLLYPSERDRAGLVIDEAVPVLFEKFPP